MTTDNTDSTDGLRRRTILKQSATAATTLAVGGTLLGQAAAAKQGGTGFIPEPQFTDRKFRIVAETPETLTRSPSCQSTPASKTYKGYEIVYEGMPPRRATLYVNPNRNLEVETGLHEFARDEQCGTERKVTFKPAKE